MKVIFQTRQLFWKQNWFSLLFWLLLPVIASSVIIVQFASLQADTKVPVGIVMEEDTALVQDLFTALKDTPHIRPVILNERDALNQLQKHELDSVFVIRKGYEESIHRGSRNQLIKSYQSDLSFAYTPLRETVISYAQQDYTRAKAAFVVQRIGEEYGLVDEWSFEELIERSKEIAQEQKLLEVDFSFANMDVEKDKESTSLLKPWNVWALISLLATFMVFDWVIKEKRSAAVSRFAFGTFSLKKYLVMNMVLYTGLLFMFDLIAMMAFYFLFDETMSFGLMLALCSYRLMLHSCIFIWSVCFTSTYLYYTSSFAITLFLALTSGALIPVDVMMAKFSLLPYVNPLGAFLTGSYLNLWLILGIVLISLWYIRKGEADA